MHPELAPERDHPLRSEADEPPERDELRLDVPLELFELEDAPGLDELDEPSLDPGPDPAQLARPPGPDELGDRRPRLANQLRSAPIGARRVGACARQVEQHGVLLERSRDLGIVHGASLFPVTTVVIPFTGVEGKTRLHASRRVRRELSLAMLGDVLAAAFAVGEPRVVTSDAEGASLAREAGADVVGDPGGGQGAAVQSALAALVAGPTLIVNADVPCVVPDDLRALLAVTPAGGIALIEALDGTTNALGLSAPEVFAPLYGPDSAARFRAHAESLGLQSVSVALPNLADDVDTLEDLQRLHLRLGPRSQAGLAGLTAAAHE